MTKPTQSDRPNTSTRKPMRVLSLCTGIAGDVAAFSHAGLQHDIVAAAEVDPVASAFLAQKFPDVRNLGDINSIKNWKDYNGKIDIIIGGIPCQPFSAAGKGRGNKDPRDLSAKVCEIIADIKPKVVLIENVPGFRTIQGGKPFAHFDAAIGADGYTTGHRVIDASIFVAQRRRRLFFCAHCGDAGVSPDELLALAESSGRVFEAGGEKRVSNTSGSAGGSAVLHPTRLGTIMASGAGMDRAGLRGHEMDFLIVQDIPGHGLIVRRPTVIEGLRAQGFSDDWLDGVMFKGRPLAKGKKFKLIGNSWPVPVAASILREIDAHWINPS